MSWGGRIKKELDCLRGRTISGISAKILIWSSPKPNGGKGVGLY